MAEVVKGDECSLSKKYLRWPVEYIASDSQVQLFGTNRRRGDWRL